MPQTYIAHNNHITEGYLDSTTNNIASYNNHFGTFIRSEVHIVNWLSGYEHRKAVPGDFINFTPLMNYSTVSSYKFKIIVIKSF